ncbi:MAG: TRAP transporter small permease [Sneathiella sp.]
MKLDEFNEEEANAASSFFTKGISHLAFASGVVSAVLIVTTLFMTGYSVFQRYVLGTPLTWTDELSGFLVVAIVMLGAAEALRKGDHIAVDLLITKVKGKNRKYLDFFGLIATAIVAGVLCFSAWAAVKFSWTIGVYSDGYLEAPLWIPQSFMLFGAGLLCLLALARAFDLLLKKR